MDFKKLVQLIFIAVLSLIFTQCEKTPFYDQPDAILKKGVNAGGGEQGGGPANGDLYGDLYQILRDVNGVPVLYEHTDGNFYVKPTDANGDTLAFFINDEGEQDFYGAEPIEVEISRLNIIRALDRVLDNAMKEVVAVISQHNIIFDPGGRIVGEVNGVYTTIESPLANMTIYKKIMPFQTVGDLFDGASSVTGFIKGMDDMLLAAACLAGATNKESTMTIDQLVYFNTFAELTGENPLTDRVGNKYYNFEGFKHNREMYKDRYLDVIKIVGTSVARDTMSVFEFMEWGSYDGTGKSATYQFLDAVNDATHVLYQVHESSLVTFLPEYKPEL